MAERAPNYWDLVEPVMGSVMTYGTVDEFLTSFAAITRPVGITYAAFLCLSEVNNGGFLQFFWNSTGILAPEAFEGFLAIGMPGLASCVSEAIDVFGTEYPRDRDVRWDAMLNASPLSAGEIESIFKETSDFYLAYVKATKPLPFDSLSATVWELGASENGGFDDAATRYLTQLDLLGPQR